jgi:AraC-like DNA-binding protein
MARGIRIKGLSLYVRNWHGSVTLAKTTLCVSFRQHLGQTPAQYILERRIANATMLLAFDATWFLRPVSLLEDVHPPDARESRRLPETGPGVIQSELRS